ncbi:MAG: Mut7-C RNAse domain-containing protein [Amphritea sp.]
MYRSKHPKQNQTEAHQPLLRSCDFRFYGQLNDFLYTVRRQRSYSFHFSGLPSLRDAIQAQGVPHIEVDLILVDSHSQPFDYHLSGGERVSVYPRFKAFEIAKSDRFSAKPLPTARFILDVHLGKLSRHLRLLGFDTLYRNDFEDSYIIDCALREQRIILTRDLGILKQNRVTHGYFVRSTDPNKQIEEVLQAFNVTDKCHPLTRCINCNGKLKRVSKAKIEDIIPEGTKRSYETFYQCQDCLQPYWRGAHHIGLMGKLAEHDHKQR